MTGIHADFPSNEAWVRRGTPQPVLSPCCRALVDAGRANAGGPSPGRICEGMRREGMARCEGTSGTRRPYLRPTWLASSRSRTRRPGFDVGTKFSRSALGRDHTAARNRGDGPIFPQTREATGRTRRADDPWAELGFRADGHPPLAGARCSSTLAIFARALRWRGGIGARILRAARGPDARCLRDETAVLAAGSVDLAR